MVVEEERDGSIGCKLEFEGTLYALFLSRKCCLIIVIGISEEDVDSTGLLLEIKRLSGKANEKKNS